MEFVPKVFVRLSHRVAQWSADHMPKRRRLRKWRYVSPRRHLIGLMLLSVLLGGRLSVAAKVNLGIEETAAGAYLMADAMLDHGIV